MSIGIIATLMLSHYSDNAVAGVGVANQILNIAILVFNITAIGATILIGQNIGANRLDIARRLARSSIGFNLWVGIGVTIIAIIFCDTFLAFYGLEGAVLQYAATFVKITGLSLFLEAISLAFSAILRSHGHTKDAMVITVIMNGISVIGNILSVTGIFGLPITGVTGVAWSIVIARIFAVFAFIFIVNKRLALKIAITDFIKFNKKDIQNLLFYRCTFSRRELFLSIFTNYDYKFCCHPWFCSPICSRLYIKFIDALFLIYNGYCSRNTNLNCSIYRRKTI